MSLYVFVGLCLCMGQSCLKSPGGEGGGSVPFYIMHATEKTSNQNAESRCIRSIYYIDTSVLLENTPTTRKFPTKPHPGLKWRILHIIAPVKISMISLISSLSLKFFLKSLVHHRNIFVSF